MDAEMSLKIRKAIQESLPAQVGEMLQKELEELKTIRAAYNDLMVLKNKLYDEIHELKLETSELKEVLAKHGSLGQKMEELRIRENNFEVNTLKYMLEAEKDKTEFSKNIALGLVRNVEYRRSIMEHKTVPVGLDQYGNTRSFPSYDTITEENTVK